MLCVIAKTPTSNISLRRSLYTISAFANSSTNMSGQQTRGGRVGRGNKGDKRHAPYGNVRRSNMSSSITGGQKISEAVAEGRPPITLPPPRLGTPPLTEVVPNNSMRFCELGDANLLHPILLQTLTQDLKFDHMMPVQEATLKPLLEKRVDCLAQAKTGTGKTVAFLLPAIQTLINRKRKAGGISLLVMTPTRELAMQIAKEASKLLGRLPQYKVSFAIGGTNKDSEERKILQGCDILIATPGRLYDHLSNSDVVHAFRNLDTLVLDEADRLLDMGFMNALKDIIKCLPDKRTSERQGMLFSATIAPHVEKFAHLVLDENYEFISTISATDTQTHQRVPQLLTIVPNVADIIPAMVNSVLSERDMVGIDTFKTIVFTPTAAIADLYAHVLSQVPGLPKVSRLHSRVSQAQRTKITEEFRSSTAAVMVATDVIARGMDFPGVTTVFQIGLPMDKESYIHRLGRTARAGAEGRSVFIVSEAESFFPTWTLKDITFQSAHVNLDNRAKVLKLAENYEDKGKAYQGWLGYYKAHMKAMKWTENDLVAQANAFALDGMLCDEIPELEKTVVGKMGLKHARGLNVVANRARTPNGRGGGGAGRNAPRGGRRSD